jgi:hypothetical protein
MGVSIVLNATFNYISDISWQSVLLVEETGVPLENCRPAASHWQILSYNVVSSTPHHYISNLSSWVAQVPLLLLWFNYLQKFKPAVVINIINISTTYQKVYFCFCMFKGKTVFVVSEWISIRGRQGDQNTLFGTLHHPLDDIILFHFM